MKKDGFMGAVVVPITTGCALLSAYAFGAGAVVGFFFLGARLVWRLLK